MPLQFVFPVDLGDGRTVFMVSFNTSSMFHPISTSACPGIAHVYRLHISLFSSWGTAELPSFISLSFISALKTPTHFSALVDIIEYCLRRVLTLFMAQYLQASEVRQAAASMPSPSVPQINGTATSVNPSKVSIKIKSSGNPCLLSCVETQTYSPGYYWRWRGGFGRCQAHKAGAERSARIAFADAQWAG